jgi:RNA polymerase sigma factor (sigma-70 family)
MLKKCRFALMKFFLQFKDSSDVDLWKQFLLGNEEAFAYIFDTFSPKLFRYGSALTPHQDVVEDSIQDIFIELWNSRTRLKETDNISYYLFKVLRRKIFRNLGSKISTNEDALDSQSELTPSIETLLIDEENQILRLELIASAIQQLTPRQREVIELRFYQGFSYEQIGEITDVKLQSVHNNVHRALTTLRMKLPFRVFDFLIVFYFGNLNF